MTIKVGINGFGRIGRMVLRSIIENNRKDLEVVAINNRGNSEISSFLLKHDTIHGKLKAKVDHSEKAIEVNGKKINLGICGDWFCKNRGIAYVHNCNTTGSITGDYAGVICGYEAGYEGTLNIYNCYTTGNIKGNKAVPSVRTIKKPNTPRTSITGIHRI